MDQDMAEEEKDAKGKKETRNTDTHKAEPEMGRDQHLRSNPCLRRAFKYSPKGLSDRAGKA